MRNQVLCAVASMAALFFVNGCVKTEMALPALTMDTTEFTVSEEGGVVMVPYTLTNPTESSSVTVEPTETYDWIKVTNVGDEVIDITVDANETFGERTAEFTMSYPKAKDVVFTVTQASRKYDYEWTMTSFSGAYFGDVYGSGSENFMITLGEKPLTEDGGFEDGATYCSLDIYSNKPESRTPPTLPAGEYTYAPMGTSDLFTFNAQIFRYTGDSDWGVTFNEGKMNVAYEGTTMNVDMVLTDTEGKMHHVTFSGDGSCNDFAPEVPGFGQDSEMDPQLAAAGYIGGSKDLMLVSLQFTDMSQGESGLVPPGKLATIEARMPYSDEGKIATGTYTASSEGESMTFTPGDDIWGYYIGSCVEDYDAEGKAQETSLFVGGTMTVSENAGVYTFDCDFECLDGYKFSFSWTGKISVSGMPFSTLEGDYTLNLEGAVGTGTLYGDYYGTNGSNWMLQILSTAEGGDGVLLDLVSDPVSLSAGIPSGTYTASTSYATAPGEYTTGSKYGNTPSGTMYLGGIKDNTATEFAPAKSGDLVVTNHGDGTYTISFKFVDDKDHTWDGEWTGNLDLKEYSGTSASTASVATVKSRQTLVNSSARSAKERFAMFNAAIAKN